ncbi:hypothetical protein LGZ99_10840 [Photorhabdus temperata]|uniref:Uncharacterized protein n=2 Tax=Photorhabdus temperata TaxID=574560 RepID=A0A081RZA9_PHOTE|nr:hypothetical protein [Photorhabdus temperata]ERT12282.1 hypothetical protein O185_14915 [Photorhabdus temperata J3]KER04012.1 hypothetical protein MEG1DRAFT_01292 [Photorhabdus temperata subsp. temperata Meg1]MCT8347696.1 hypothetical protein [Photorhabdus temperata]
MKIRNKILSALIKVSSAIEIEFDNLMIRDVFISKRNPRRLRYVDEFAGLVFIGINTPIICKTRPEFVKRLSLHEWLIEQPDENRDENSFPLHRRLDVGEYFGLDTERGFFPASGAKGPFKYLLKFHPRLALDFIIQLLNTAVQKYANSEFAQPKQNEENSIMPFETTAKEVELILNDGTVVKQYASPHLWKGYRGVSTLPCLLQCALMALENWLIEVISSAKEISIIERIFDYILRSSNSVMPTSVLASVALGFPDQIGKAIYPLLRTPAFGYGYLFNRQKEAIVFGKYNGKCCSRMLAVEVELRAFLSHKRSVSRRKTLRAEFRASMTSSISFCGMKSRMFV